MYVEFLRGMQCFNANKYASNLQVSGSSGGSGCSVCALWNAGESALAAFNVASGDGAPAYMSLALDLVIRGIPDPLR